MAMVISVTDNRRARANPWPGVAGLATVAVLATAGCGGLPSGGQDIPTAATVIVTIGPEGTQEPLNVEAIVICGGVRATYSPNEPYVVLKNVPFGTETPPRQPITVTARGYRTHAEWIQLNVSASTYVDVGLTPVDLSQTGTVQGTVKDALANTPIVNAHVSFSQQIADQTVEVDGFTDSDGAFIIGGVPIGLCEVTVVATGYLEYRSQVGVSQDAGGQTPPLNVTLVSGSAKVRVSGTVVDIVSGSPIAGATVKLGDLSTTTDSNGSFVFEQVGIGSAELVVEAQGYDIYRQTISVTPGMRPLRIELTEASPMPPAPPHNVTGTVRIVSHPDDNSGVLVSAYSLDLGLTVAEYTTGPDGRYYLYVPPGNYEIRVSYEGQRLVRNLTVPGGGRILTGIDFAL
ncbi:MAG: carboxypeptidase regulatory-like domain-containing protein [Armatimonadetes bacterium]|nr:carboxypeptidase regulatory-like domain-containing protein [Armatimonadota bacterium]